MAHGGPALDAGRAGRQSSPAMTDDAASDPMEAALAEAEAAAARDEVPIGAVIVDAASGRIVARAGNRVEELKDPTAHAELLAIREAARVLGAKRLPKTELWVTLEPCPMCAQAASFARVARLVFAAEDPKGGGVVHGPRIFGQPTCFHRPAIARGSETQAQRAGDLLRTFFRLRRNANQEC